MRLQLLSQLHDLARAMGEPLLATIQDYFLFTIVGTVVTSRKAVVFILGDGVLAINGAYRQITYLGNAPPYLAYGLVREALDPAWYDQLAFQVHWDGPATDLQAILIGTDGVDDLYRVADQHLPGRAESVGPLSQFWCDNRYFVNPYAIARRLALINRTLTRYDWQRRRVQHAHGLLADDTTLIVIRRNTHCQPKG